MKYKLLTLTDRFPIPENYRPTNRLCMAKSFSRKYPFDVMKIGESFLVKDKSAVALKRAANEFKAGRLAPVGWNFCVRTKDNGVRLWRVS
jgi:hypothetical protein